MKKSLMLFGLLSVSSMFAFAESFHGKLVDSACYEQQKSATNCDPTSTTSMFSLYVSDKAYRLDQTGNTKAAEAIKSRADRTADPAKPAAKEVMATITGTKDAGDVLKVDSISVQ